MPNPSIKRDALKPPPLCPTLDSMKTPEQMARATVLLRSILNEWDPYGLIESGSGPDEYDQELNRLLPLLAACSSLEDVVDAVGRSFVEGYAEEAQLRRIYNHAGLQIFDRFKSEGLL